MLDTVKSHPPVVQSMGFNIGAARIIEAASDLPIEEMPAAQLFGLPSLGKLIVERRLPHTLPVEPVHDHYLFRSEILKPLLAWLLQPGGDAFFLSGPMGASKTSSVTQVTGRLNWPTIVFSWGPDHEFDTHLVGTVDAANGTTFFKYGPLPIAMHYGMVLVINEIDAGVPGRLTPLFDILEGRDLFIPQTNEVIRAHPDFRIVVTANTIGTGDPTGLYRARKVMDGAFMDRFRGLVVGYPTAAEEFQILNRRFPLLGKIVIEKLVSYAAETRKQAGDETDGITIPLSIRTLSRIGEIMDSYGVAVDAPETLEEFKTEILKSMELAYWFRLDEADEKAARTLFTGVFGLEA